MNSDNGQKFAIAIDGPAGAGKSTIARAVAKELGYIYVDTGAMYRAMALYLLRNGMQYDTAQSDPAAFESRAALLCRDADISIRYQDNEQIVLLAGENVNPYIRTGEVSAMASASSALSCIRERMVEIQKNLALQENVVMDGRDIGTVVLPNAQVKVFLTAGVKERARRRYLEDLEKYNREVSKAQETGAGVSLKKPDLEKIEEDIRIRDERDMNRQNSPLRQADDAVLVDSSDMSVDQVMETILNLVCVKKKRPQVITAKTAGFCFGVRNAIDTVYKQAEAKENGPINTFGPIIHNEIVVEDLRKKGVGVINTVEEIDAQEGGTIIIRSHGVSKALYERALGSRARVIDTTCTFVKRIHEIVQRESLAGKHIIIIGNHGHAEVEGTMGWAEGPVTVIESKDEALAFDAPKDVPLCVVAQTTFNERKFQELVATLKSRDYNCSVENTICNATHERQTEAGKIASLADVMIVIGSRSSSNTAKLYDICSEVCDRTVFLTGAEEPDLNLTGAEKIIGITAGASTPKNIIKEVQNHVRRTEF